jgi:hypothetical protein
MKVIQSKDHNRINPLSVEPGGSTISVTYDDGTIIHYDKIKSVAAYVKKTATNPKVTLISQGDNIIYKKA